MGIENLNKSFLKAESKWMNPILEHLVTLYNSVNLPSHDLSHHLRVWNYCKELLIETSKIDELYSDDFIQQVLIASLFHDTGLIFDKSEQHGNRSKLLCQEFFYQNPQLKIENIDVALTAIEHHDDKSFKTFPREKVFELSDIVTIVSTADDLDAFGYIGVFRYLEIYALRGIPFEDMPRRILENLSNRFANFQNNYSHLSVYMGKHNNRFLLTHNFFDLLNQEVTLKIIHSDENQRIAKLLIKCLTKEKMDIKSTIVTGLISSPTANSLNFFMGLKDELGY
jgi:HD superfamily phosphodiesterase